MWGTVREFLLAQQEEERQQGLRLDWQSRSH
jgi:hypothetical protein